MKLLNQVKNELVNKLWQNYLEEVMQANMINHLLVRNNKKVILDHFAIIDLPSDHTGIPMLTQIFSSLGFIVQGRDYLPEKQNEFLWLVEEEAFSKSAETVLPQVVVADFRLDELPITIRKIIEKYTRQIRPSPLPMIQHLTEKACHGNVQAANELLTLLLNYFNCRGWELPSRADFTLVHEANELLAWVLLFGRKPNHFTISVHLLGGFKNLMEFHSFITSHVKCTLNNQGNVIKGNKEIGIMQSSTMADLINVQLEEGDIIVRDRFVEFMWRYHKNDIREGNRWKDFHTGFFANNANNIIESLF